MSRIFISYKRTDSEKVQKIKNFIESQIGEDCWMDINGIESDAEFKDVIIRAINNCEIVLFMYSKRHLEIEDYDKDWTIKEHNFAIKKNKRLVFINIDGSPLADIFEFDYGTKQQIDGTSEDALLRLTRDLKKWLNISDSGSASTASQASDSSESGWGDFESLVLNKILEDENVDPSNKAEVDEWTRLISNMTK